MLSLIHRNLNREFVCAIWAEGLCWFTNGEPRWHSNRVKAVWRLPRRIHSAGDRLRFRRDRTIGERSLAEDRRGDRQTGRVVPVRRTQWALSRRDRKAISAAGRCQKSDLFKLPG